MFTECPACNTVFRVYPEQLAAAKGKVRCGDCLAVFDAREYLREDLEVPALPEERSSVAAPDNQATFDLTLPDPPPPNAADRKRASAPPPVAHEPPVTKRAPRARVEPSFVVEAHADHPSHARGWWGVSALLLVLLFAQYVWFNRVALSQIPNLQPAMLALCRVAPCDLERAADPSVFELTSRSVQSHPSYQGALLVDVTFVNRSAIARPYPGLELTFADMEGKPLASRRFLPSEYLGSAPQQPLAANTEAHVVLELLDPGDLAVGFEFRFF